MKVLHPARVLSFNMTNMTGHIRWMTILLLLLAGLALTILFSLSLGTENISVWQIPEIFLHRKPVMDYQILSLLKLPRIILAISVGGALSLSGLILQGVYRNPLVEPYTLGISGGAALGVCLALMFRLQTTIGSIANPLAGFAGALIIILVIYLFSLRKGNVQITSMLLTGVMISFITSSLLMLIMALSRIEDLHGIVFWTMGSLDEPSPWLITIAAVTSVSGLLITSLFVHSLNALRLGKEPARHLGINTNRTIRVLFIVASLLTGVSVAVAGVIGFVGLLVPHIMRRLTGSDYRLLLPASFIAGAIYLTASDTIARTIIQPNELPVGVITGLLGGSLFLWLQQKENKGWKI
ncbi:iron ABC transporter permease [Prolixibacter sp. NT017]|uniref:FecCD family ABC transporter permease n=1 Tax=Prolixibacter sp. NT017 TaxID=2652390 RepID=UPI001E5576DD|nr:iron ABC transporter permease [Prolixibacter sp. NT017]